MQTHTHTHTQKHTYIHGHAHTHKHFPSSRLHIYVCLAHNPRISDASSDQFSASLLQVTRPHVWHSSSVHVSWDSSVYVTWLILIEVLCTSQATTTNDFISLCDAPRLYTWHVSFMCMTRLSRMCDMTHSHAWYESFIRATWLIHLCDMTPSCLLLHICNMTHSSRLYMSLYLRFHQLKLFLFIFTLQPIRRYIPSSSSLLRRPQSKSVLLLLSDHTSTSRKRKGEKARNFERVTESERARRRKREREWQRARERDWAESNSYGN